MGAAEIAAALGGAEREGQGWRCRCPAHEDHNPSLAITEREGKTLFTCRAGCDQAAVLAALRERQLWPPAGEPRRNGGAGPPSRIAATYDYRDEKGALRYQVVRREPKDFYQRRPNGADGQWLNGRGGTAPLPYRLPDLLADPGATVFIAEGEKDCDALAALGLVATCNDGGAGKWRPEISHWLTGRNVVVVPDNDEAGCAHAKDVAAKLAGIAANARIIELPGLPPKGDISDWLAAGGAREELERLAADAPIATAPMDGGGVELVRFADMRPHLGGRALVKGLLSREQSSAIVGAKGCGKTFLALSVGLHVAAGLDWFGHRVTEGGVVYVAAEAGRSIINRVAAWKFAHAYDEDAAIPFSAVTSAVDLCHADAGDVDRLLAAIRGASFDRIALVVVDTVSRALAGGDENSPGDMGALVRSLDRLRDELHSHVLAVHHFGKDRSRGARGHSLLEAALDTIVEVERDEAAKVSTATVTKQRDGATGAEITFRLRPVELGRDEDGDPVTSCIVEPIQGEAPARKRQQPALTPRSKVALDTLRRAIEAHAEPAPPHNYIPASARVIKLDLWRRFYLSGTSGDGQAEDTRRKAWHRATEALQAAKCIAICDEMVWLT